MVAKTDTYITEVGRYLREFKGGESIRSVARRAGVSHSVFADLLAGKSMPKASTLKKIGKALECNETTLLRLAGYLEEAPHSISDPRAIYLAQQLDKLPKEVREPTIQAMEAQVRVIYELVGGDYELNELAAAVAADEEAAEAAEAGDE